MPRVAGELAAVDLDDLRDQAVQELAVVRGHDQRALEVAQEPLEPEDRLDVEVVGRLVEQQRVGLHEQDARERDAHLPAARELADVAVDHLGREAEAREDLARARFERVAAELVEARLHLAEALDSVSSSSARAGSAIACSSSCSSCADLDDLAGAGHRLLEHAAARPSRRRPG